MVDANVGQDPDGNVTVTVDPAHRVARFVVNRADGVRTPEALQESARRAYREALVAQSRTTASASETASGSEPRTAVATVPRLVPRSRELLERHRVRGETAAGPRRRAPAVEVGESDNRCVRVTLVPASSRGVISADPGWLSQATASQISQSVHQAFIRAYEQRDL